VRYVVAFGRFWYDFIVGDDWKIAAGVAAVLGAGAALIATDAVGGKVLAPVLAAAIALVVTASILAGARRG
jgi:hypothetical protein